MERRVGQELQVADWPATVMDQAWAWAWVWAWGDDEWWDCD